MNPQDLEKWSFWWSEARLLVAAVALLLGGVPPVLYVVSTMPALYGIVGLGLKLSWIISGLASVYLIYTWSTHSYKVFGGKDTKDSLAFVVLAVSGLNLGFA